MFIAVLAALVVFFVVLPVSLLALFAGFGLAGEYLAEWWDKRRLNGWR